MSTSKLFSVLLLVGTTAHALPVGDRRERALTSTPSPDGKPAPATTVIPDTAQDRAATPDTTTSSSSTTTSSSTTSSTTSTTTTYEPRTAPAADTKPPPTTTTGEPPIFRQNTAADGDLEFEVDAGAGKAKRHKKAKKSKNGKKKGKAADSGLLIVPQLSAYTTSGSAVGVVAGVTLVAVAVVAVSCRRSRTTDHAQFLENNPLVASESTPLLV